MLVQRFEPQGWHFTNLHYYYYSKALIQTASEKAQLCPYYSKDLIQTASEKTQS